MMKVIICRKAEKLLLILKSKNMDPSSKRRFLKTIAYGSILSHPALSYLEGLAREYEDRSALELAGMDDFWKKVRGQYKIEQDYINLENGYYCKMPEPVLEAYIGHVRRINLEASRYLRTEQFERKYSIAALLAKKINATKEELIITRNTTESLDLVIAGYPWEEGDEAIMCDQDYGAMLDMFRQQEKRKGIRKVVLELPNHPESDEEIVRLYEQAITPRTRMIMVCHMINITGQILPVKKICEMAHKHGVEVMVDGAHAFAHIPVDVQEIGCDYYGASLHKWLSAPLGSGILYVQKDKIGALWPLFAESPKPQGDILRLNHTGTIPVHVDLGIQDALDYYEWMGHERKEQRLRFLKNYWLEDLKIEDGLVIHTPLESDRSCAIGNIGIEGMDPSKLANVLFDEFGIWTVAINHSNVKGVRVTPNVFTTQNELNQFKDAILSIKKRN